MLSTEDNSKTCLLIPLSLSPEAAARPLWRWPNARGRRGRQETDVIWQLMYSQTLPIGPTRDHPQKVNLTLLFVLWPSDCCCCPHIDLIHRTMWQQGKEQQVWKGNLFLIWTCERVHSFVVINCQRCMTDFYSGNTQQWGSIRGEGRSLPYSIIASVVQPKENQKKEKLLQFLELVTKEFFLSPRWHV